MEELVLDVQNLKHSFRKGNNSIEVFRDINLQVRGKQVVAIRGDSGSGKTTLLLACGGMLRPEKGDIVLDGINLFSATSVERNRVRSFKIGYLFQTLELIPYLTVLDNLTLHDRSLKTEAIDWLDRFDLGDRIRHKPHELSHGQRQRVALIRAIVHQPQLLIADEPTGNLDEKNTQMVFEILRHFADNGGSVLVASHDASVEAFANQSYQLNNGGLSKMHDESIADVTAENQTPATTN